MQGIHAVTVNIYELESYNSSCFSFSFIDAVDDSVSDDVDAEAVDAVEDDEEILGLGTLGCFFDVNFSTYQISMFPCTSSVITITHSSL